MIGNENQAEAVTRKEELMVAGESGEDPVALAVDWDEHGSGGN